MKNIQTKIFKAADIWQLGFLRLNLEERRELKCLKGFRYHGEMRVWHITHHVNTLNYLNNKYSDRYYFLKDPVGRKEAPVFQATEKHLKISIRSDEETGRMVLEHTYHRELFSEFSQMKEGRYDRSNRQWLMQIDLHLDQVKEKAAQYGFEIEIIIKEKVILPDNLNRKDNENKMQAINKFKRELFLRNRSKRTIESYVSSLSKFLDSFEGRDYQEISNEEIRDYLHLISLEKSYSFSTMNVIISAIKTYYSVIFGIDLQQVDLPRPKNEKRLPKVLSFEEVKKMIECLSNQKHKAIISVLYSTGIRRDELLSIRMEDVDMEQDQIHIHGKGAKDRYVYISSNLKVILLSFLKSRADSPLLFSGQGGAKYSASSLGKILLKAAKIAGINKRVTPHMLRHSLATHFINQGIGIAHIQKILGHADIKTTMIYTHITDNDIRKLPNPFDSMDI